ncbi:hornerin [Anopheles marshallii]|uniref:hornerin n=1 Tax=Anopheles marshallii TaxID=1521116 RepID=UPI00237C138B|nr:hornerin [Anopheles marshallii]
MYSQNDGRSSSSTARASAASTVPQRYPPNHHTYGGGRGFLGSYGSSTTPSSSLENQRSIEGQHSASTTGTATTSLFGDPVLPATRHADLLGGEDLYQNLKNNIELYHAKLYNDQERQRQAERDALFDQYANGVGSVGGRKVSAGVVKPTVGNNMTTYSEMPARSRSFGRTQSASIGVDLSNSRSNLFDMDLLKQNDWIDFSEHEYQHSLIPTNSRTVADVQQFTGGNITRRIENGVFQNPRAAAAARASRRNSITDASAYGMRGGMVGDNATFTVLGHGPMGYEEGASALPVGGIHDPSTSSDANSEFERMLRYGRTDPSTAIIRDKINTGSNFRVSDARQHKNTAFTIINEVLPKSSSFDLAGGNRYSPYREKHRLASSRILSASSATHGTSNVGFYGYGYGADFMEEGSISAPHGHRRRFSSSELSLSTIGGRTKEGHPAEGSARTKRPAKSKTSLSLASNPGRRQRGVLEVISKKSTTPSAKVTITQPSEDGRSITPTPSESGLSGTGTDGDRISIPEHQLKNMKLFGYKPFSSRPTLSPVPDKGSMESSQADLKEGSGGGKEGGKKGSGKGGFRAPVFNIRGLLMSPRSRDKSKEMSPSGGEDSKEPSVERQTKPQGKEPPSGKEPEAHVSPPKKRRFNLARAIIESARKGPEPEPEKVSKPQTSKAAQEEDSGEKRKMALKMKFGIVRSGVRKDSEGNGVKEKRAGGKKGKGAKVTTRSAATSAKDKKKAPVNKKGTRYDDDDDDYFDPYRQRDRDERSSRTKKASAGGGMLKSALNYAASFRTRSDRVGTAGPGGRRKPADVDLPKGAKASGQRGGKDGGMEKLTPNARRRDKSAKAGERDTRGKPGGVGAGRVKSGKGQTTGGTGVNRAKSAAGARGRQLRRSSSAVGLDPGQLRKANKLYEKNQKASTGAGGSMGAGKGGRGGKSSSSLIQSKANRHSDNDMAGSGSGLAKSDSRGEMRGKGSSKATDGTGSDSKDRIEKRDSERSLKKSDSNKSIVTLGGKPKKSDSKSSLLNKRSDSRSSLHQTAATAAGGETSGGGGDTSGTELGGKSPLNSMTEGVPDPGVKSARPTPKLQSKGSLLSLISLKGSKRNLDRGAGGADAGQRPDTANTAVTGADGAMASSTRLQSASMRNAPGTATSSGEGAAEDAVGSRAAGMNEKPTSTKPLRRMMSRGSLLSIKSIAHARSFTNIRPPTAAAAATGADGEGGGTMPPQTMQKVTEGSQEHDDTTDTETSHGGGGATGGDGQGSMGVATHELTVAGDGEGEKVSNEYNGEHRMKSPMAEHKQQQGSRSPGMDNVSSANTESMRDRTMGQEGAGGTNNSDEFGEDEQLKCSKCCCACCAPCWTRTCLPFRRCFRSCSGCCGGGRNRLGKRKADGQLANEKEPTTAKQPGQSCWERLLGCCRRCRNSKTAPESTAIVQRAPAESKPKASCWQSLNCCASCRRNKSRELVPRSSIDSDPPAEDQSRCRSCWSKLFCCCRPKPDDGKSKQIKRHKMEEPVEMETVKCCFCFKRQRPKVKAKPKKKVPVKSTFNCLSCCMMCCKKKGDNQSRRTSNLSKKQSIAPTIPPEDLRPKIDMSLVEHSSLMRGAIPVLPICLAYFCLFLNVVVPGSGTVLSGGLCLCIGKPRFSQHDSIKGRIGSFIINCIVGVSQCFTIIFCVVGWGWAIWWGTIMIRLARQHRKILEMEAAQEEGEEQTTLSNRTGASNPPVALVSKTHRDVETGR